MHLPPVHLPSQVQDPTALETTVPVEDVTVADTERLPLTVVSTST